MAEVLITLGVIGIVAAMTLPSLFNKAEKIILAQQFKKSYANIQNAINLVQAEYGAPYECYNTGFGNYHISECTKFWQDLLSKMKVLQKCEQNDYKCHPKYKTKAEVLAEGGEVINNSCTMNLNLATILYYVLNDGTYLIVNNKYGTSSHNMLYFGIDINGAKGPNRWGYDLFYLTLNLQNNKQNVIATHKVCAMKEKGGEYLMDMFLK